MSKRFCNILVDPSLWCIYYVTKVVQRHEEVFIVDSIIVVDALTCTLFSSPCYLKAMQMNVQCNLIWELMLYKFKLGHNAVKATKNICFAKGEGSVDQSTVNWEFKEFHSGCKNLDEQGQVGLKTWILKSHSKLWRQIWWVGLREYQVSEASHSPVWFVTFTTLAKPCGAIDLCLILPK